MSAEAKVPKAVFENPDNWVSSYKKWRDILERINNRGPFLGLLSKSCGYCKEFILNCNNCTLYKKDICRNAGELNVQMYIFWKLNKMAYFEDIDWDLAISYAQKIFAAILEDKPDGIDVSQI